MIHDSRLVAGMILLGATAAACAGGGGSVTPQPPDAGQGKQPRLNQAVTFTVEIPKAQPPSSKLRRTRDTVYVSPNTASIGIQIAMVDGQALLQAPPVSVGNVPRPCIGSTGGCTVTVGNVPAAVGADAFSVTTYAGAGATGAIVSQGLVPVQVGTGANSATVGGTTLSIGGFVAQLGLTITPSTFYLGAPLNASVLVVAKDASGAIIVGNTQFAVPITIAASPVPQFEVFRGNAEGASLVLNGPEAPGGLVHLRYNGSTQISSGSVSASSQDGNGNPIVARENVAVLPSPNPTPSGPIDVYVLNGADNSLAEFTGSGNAQRRAFGGKQIGCTPRLKGAPSVNLVSLGSSGLAFDGTGNALVGTAVSCAHTGAQEKFFALAPDAVGTAIPSATYVTSDQNVNTLNALAFDETLQYLDASDGSLNVYAYEYRLSGNTANQAAAFGQTNGAPTCFLLPSATSCGDGAIAPNTFVTYAINGGSIYQFGQTFTLDGHGFGYYPAVDTSLFNFNILQLPLISEPPQGPAIANPGWIAGITPYSQAYGPADANRLSNYPLGLAVDGNLLFVLNYPTRQALFIGSQRYLPYYPPAAICNSNPSATPSPVGSGSLCQDGTAHEFLTVFDLTQLKETGANNLQPVLVVGGDQFPGNGAAGAQFADRIGVGGGQIYIAEPAGTSCDATCLANLGKKPIGRIAIYPETLRGSHINDGASAPSATIEGKSIKFPTAVTLGPQGTGQGGIRPR
jgi:hypothetical protein